MRVDGSVGYWLGANVENSTRERHVYVVAGCAPEYDVEVSAVGVGRTQSIRERLGENRHLGQDLERMQREVGLREHLPAELVAADDVPAVQRALASGMCRELSGVHH